MKILGRLVKRQKGFTLIETAVAIAISGLIGLGASIAIAQVSTETSRNTDYTMLSQQTMNAIYWLGQDIQMAQTIDGADDFPAAALRLSWKWWDNHTYSVNYTLEDGSLVRTYSDGTSQVRTLVAEYILSDDDLTNCVSDNGTVTFTITAGTGEGTHEVNVTRVREICPRPHL
jgi:prepilin-type N-terminal cleavage/methylation domain-containing protein